MKKIQFIFRSKKSGYSIGRVFETIADELSKSAEVTKLYVPSPFAGFSDIITNIRYILRTVVTNEIIHITGDVHYLCWLLPRKKLIVTVHDIWFYDIMPFGIKKLMKYMLWILPLRRAKKVICISNETKERLLKRIKLKDDQVKVIHDPVSPDYHKSEKPFNKEKPVILHLGVKPNKNLPNLIPALQGISCHLRMVGVMRDDYKQLLEKYGTDYSCVSNLTDQQVVEEYLNCDIVNLISLHEGFGMPVIEGQAANKPVVTSNLSPMKEIAGDGAVLVNPLDQQEIHNAYKRLIEDDDFREDVRRKGYENVKRFSVSEITRQYIEVYNELSNNLGL